MIVAPCNSAASFGAYDVQLNPQLFSLDAYFAASSTNGIAIRRFTKQWSFDGDNAMTICTSTTCTSLFPGKGYAPVLAADSGSAWRNNASVFVLATDPCRPAWGRCQPGRAGVVPIARILQHGTRAW